MAKRKRTKGQTTIYKTLNRELKVTGSSHTAERNMTARKIVLFTNDRNVKHTCIDIYTAEITPVFVLVLAGFVLFISYYTSSRFQFRVVGYDFPVKTMSDSS
jgi:hypothetical protein